MNGGRNENTSENRWLGCRQQAEEFELDGTDFA
jgi:hypothetical protein